MADNTSIEWARHPVTGKRASWNPVLARTKALGLVGYHCEHVSPGCQFCYAESHNQRKLPKSGTGLQFKPGHRALVDIFLDEEKLLAPLHWRAPRGVFVCSMTDLFGGFVPDEMIDRIFAVMALAPRHVFMVLTKRPDRMREYLSDPAAARRIHELACDLVLEHEIKVVLIAPGIDEARAPAGERIYLGQWPLPNVWLGTSAEDQERANERIPELLRTPAAKRFLSLEPLLERVDLSQWLFDWGCGCGWGGNHPLDYCGCGWRGEAISGEGDPCPDCGKLLADYQACPQCDGFSSDGMSFGPNSSWVHWVIAGFESGRQARVTPDAEAIARSLRDQCAAAGVPFLFKQWGSWALAPEGVSWEAARNWAIKLRYSLTQRDSAWGGSGGTPGRYEILPNGRFAFHTGKKGAGRLLDGVVHDEMPGLEP